MGEGQAPRQQYTKEFREQAVQLVLEQQVTIPEAARRLTMSGRTLERWVCRARQGQLATLGESRRPVTELEAEVARLKRELAEYIESFYNRQRRHSRLGNRSPAAFAQQWVCQQPAA